MDVDEITGNTSNETLVDADEPELDQIDSNSDESDDSTNLAIDTSSNSNRPQHFNNRSAKRLHTNVLKILNYMQSHMKISLASFLYALFYGDKNLRANPKAKRARSKLVNDPYFATIITNMMQPPRTSSKGKRARNAHTTIAAVSLRILKQALKAELDDFAGSVYMHPSNVDSFSADDWDAPTVNSLSKDALSKAPRLCDLLLTISAPESAMASTSNGSSDRNFKVFLMSML
jgi:hypothetical protein